jgi:hypothetical protein
MSALLPIFPEQRERWARARPEPVELAMPGWDVRIDEPDETFPNQRSVTFTKGGARIQLTRWWDMPRNPGYPMATASERDIEVAGRTVKLVTTSIFDGAPRRVLVFWLTGTGHDVDYNVRVVLDGCDDVDEVIRNIRVHW